MLGKILALAIGFIIVVVSLLLSFGILIYLLKEEENIAYIPLAISLASTGVGIYILKKGFSTKANK